MRLSALTLVSTVLCAPASASASSSSQPNIIFFLTDDQDVEMGSLAYMPQVRANLVEKGATFTRMYAHVPVCCPSRSSLISGQYMHNNGCRGNGLDSNCSSHFFQNTSEPRSYVTDLKNAGYRTSFAGKYLNLYGDPSVGGTAHVPPGWSNWQGLVGNSRYYDYTLSNNGVAEKHGSDYASDYFPDIILNKTLSFLDANLGQAPVFAVLSTPSCHGPQTAAPQHQDDFPGARSPRTPTFNATVPDTHWLQAVKGVYLFDDNAASFSDLVFRRRVQTLQTVDEMLVAVIDALTAKGQLENTYIVYTADNGYHAGAFGIVYDKRNPWETDTHLPLLIRGPGIVPGSATAAPVSMTDLSATFLDMAGVPVPPYFDGVSVLPLAKPAPPAPHIATYIQYVGEGGGGGARPICARTANDNAIMCNNAGNYSEPPYFFGDDFCLCQDAVNNTYTCIRVVEGVDALQERATMLDVDGVKSLAAAGAADYRYCEFNGADKVVEFFDYTLDPYELSNAAATMDPALKAALHERLVALGSCVGSAQCAPLLTTPIGARITSSQ